MLSKVMLRRTKQNTPLLVAQLPTKTDHIVFCRLADIQLRAYRRFLDTPDVLFVLTANDPCPCGSPYSRRECREEGCPGYWRLTWEQGGVLWPHYHLCDCQHPWDGYSKKGCKRHKPKGCLIMPFCPYCLVLPICNRLRAVREREGVVDFFLLYIGLTLMWCFVFGPFFSPLHSARYYSGL
jgi:hypothetical protein